MGIALHSFPAVILLAVSLFDHLLILMFQFVNEWMSTIYWIVGIIYVVLEWSRQRSFAYWSQWTSLWPWFMKYAIVSMKCDILRKTVGKIEIIILSDCSRNMCVTGISRVMLFFVILKGVVVALSLKKPCSYLMPLHFSKLFITLKATN